MSFEITFEPWEEMQRHGHNLADRLAQGFNGLLHSPPPLPWPSSPQHKIDPVLLPPSPADGVSAILDIGNRLGQAGVELGSCINGVVQQFFRQIPVSFPRLDETEWMVMAPSAQLRIDGGKKRREEAVDRSLRAAGEEEFSFLSDQQLDGGGVLEPASVLGGLNGVEDEEGFEFDFRTFGRFGKPQGSFNMISTYDSRTNDIESLMVARGDLWRAEASHGGSNSRHESSPLFLIQLGPVLFVRDTTLLLPVHLSKQHLLWYGYDRKNGMHSLCPAIWSKHRRWLWTSMICLNPFTCTFMDLQFPNGQLTYVAGEGLTTSAFLPLFGGLLQAQGQYPGETRFSFSCNNKSGTRITPMVQWPDKSFSLGVVQALAWKRSGLMLRPTIQFSICPTFGGSNPGLHAELIHSLKEKLSVNCGCSCTIHPSAFASLALGRSKWNGNSGSSGIVLRAETPLNNIGLPSFSVQLNFGVEF